MDVKIILEMTGGALREGEELKIDYPYAEVGGHGSLFGLSTGQARTFEPLGIAVVTRTYEGVSTVKTIVPKLEVSP